MVLEEYYIEEFYTPAEVGLTPEMEAPVTDRKYCDVAELNYLHRKCTSEQG